MRSIKGRAESPCRKTPTSTDRDKASTVHIDLLNRRTSAELTADFWVDCTGLPMSDSEIFDCRTIKINCRGRPKTFDPCVARMAAPVSFIRLLD